MPLLLARCFRVLSRQKKACSGQPLPASVRYRGAHSVGHPRLLDLHPCEHQEENLVSPLLLFVFNFFWWKHIPEAQLGMHQLYKDVVGGEKCFFFDIYLESCPWLLGGKSTCKVAKATSSIRPSQICIFS